MLIDNLQRQVRAQRRHGRLSRPDCLQTGVCINLSAGGTARHTLQ